MDEAGLLSAQEDDVISVGRTPGVLACGQEGRSEAVFRFTPKFFDPPV